MSQEEFFLACGLLSAVLSTCAYLPYLYSMVLGTARPLRSTWLIWAVLSAISAATNIAEGASGSLLSVCVQAGFTTLIFFISLRFGMGRFIQRRDRQVLLLAVFGLGLWWLTDNAALALAISIGISAVGGFATIVKTYHAPHTEPAHCWIVSSAAAFMGLLSVGTLDPVLMAYPAYLLALYLGILIAKFLGAAKGAQPIEVEFIPVPLLLAPRQRVW